MLSERMTQALNFADEAYVNKETNPPVVLTMEEANSILVAFAELSDEHP